MFLRSPPFNETEDRLLSAVVAANHVQGRKRRAKLGYSPETQATRPGSKVLLAVKADLSQRFELVLTSLSRWITLPPYGF